MTSSIARRLLRSLESRYDICADERCKFLEARCDYFEHSESFVLSRKASLWKADCEEFLYLFKAESLTEGIYSACMEFVDGDWKERAHIGSGHMYTYVTPVFVCGSCEPQAERLLRRRRTYKNFRLGFWGWMEYHCAAVCAESGRIVTNGRGRCLKKSLAQVLQEELRGR